MENEETFVNKSKSWFDESVEKRRISISLNTIFLFFAVANVYNFCSKKGGYH